MARKDSYIIAFLGSSREKRELIQKEVSAKTGIPLDTIRCWKQGQNDLDISSFIQLVEFYDFSLNLILEMESDANNRARCPRKSKNDIHSISIIGEVVWCLILLCSKFKIYF